MGQANPVWENEVSQNCACLPGLGIVADNTSVTTPLQTVHVPGVHLVADRCFREVNAPPPKGGGFVLRLKSAIPAKAGLSPADAGLSGRGLLPFYTENIVRVVDLLFDIGLDHIIRDVTAAATEISSRPQVAPPIGFAQMGKLTQ